MRCDLILNNIHENNLEVGRQIHHKYKKHVMYDD